MSDTNKPEKLRDQVLAAFEAVEEAQSEPEVADDIEDTSSSEKEVEESISDESDKESDENPSDGIEPPDHWSKEDVEVFKELDAKAQKLYLKRHKEMEAGYTKKSQSLAEEKKIAEKFRKAIEPYQGYFKEKNIDEFDAFQKAASAHVRLLNASPQEKSLLIQKLALDYGVNMGQQNYPQADVSQGPQADPAIQAIYDELNRTRQYIAHQEQVRTNQEVYSLQNQIDTFANMKDDKGELKHPHFETVREQMGALMQIGQADNLDTAYKKAIYLNDDLRDEHIMRQNKVREREEANKQRLASSKKAGFNVKSGSVSQISDPKQPMSTRQILERAYDAQIRI